MLIRDATAADLPEILAIYNDVVNTTTAIYDERESTFDERRAWLEERQKKGLPVLVAEADGIVGFSSFGEWRARWGYRYCVEHSVHVRKDRRAQGIGRALIEALFPRARTMGMHVMVAIIDSDAVSSVHLHRKLGFEMVGTFRQVGHKFDRWLDLVAMQRML